MILGTMNYPVLCFSQGIVEAVLTSESLCTCTKVALRNGYFKGLLVVDSEGKTIKVAGARKLHGVGLFWGYNIFLNQRIRVELIVDGEPSTISADDVKHRVLESFRKWHGWAARGDFAELKLAVRKASTIPEIIELLKSQNPNQKLR